MTNKWDGDRRQQNIRNVLGRLGLNQGLQGEVEPSWR